MDLPYACHITFSLFFMISKEVIFFLLIQLLLGTISADPNVCPIQWETAIISVQCLPNPIKGPLGLQIGELGILKDCSNILSVIQAMEDGKEGQHI